MTGERGAGGAAGEASDAALIERHNTGDRSAFEEIVTRYERAVYAVAVRMCGEPEDARDVVQETFISAMRGLRTFRADAKLSTWLHRITVNAALDSIRRRQRRETRPLEEVAERADPVAGPEEEAVRSERASAVRSALARLGADHRAVLVLHDLEQLDYAEVAEVLDIPLGTVKSRIHRARLEMARLLGHLKESEPAGDHGPLT